MVIYIMAGVWVWPARVPAHTRTHAVKMEGPVDVVKKAEHIDDLEKFLQGKSVESVLQDFNIQHRKFKMLEQQVQQRRVKMMGKLPEIEKALSTVNVLIERGSEETVIDYELAESVYAKAKIKQVKAVNLWLGADVMVEYSLDEAKVSRSLWVRGWSAVLLWGGAHVALHACVCSCFSSAAVLLCHAAASCTPMSSCANMHFNFHALRHCWRTTSRLARPTSRALRQTWRSLRTT